MLGGEEGRGWGLSFIPHWWSTPNVPLTGVGTVDTAVLKMNKNCCLLRLDRASMGQEAYKLQLVGDLLVVTRDLPSSSFPPSSLGLELHHLSHDSSVHSLCHQAGPRTVPETQ